MVKLLKNKLQAEDTDSVFFSLHFAPGQPLHQTKACGKVCTCTRLKRAIDPFVSVVSIIRARAFLHRKFKSFLENVEAQYEDIIYHNSVRWLGLEKVIKRVWTFQSEIQIFHSAMSRQNISFCVQINHEISGHKRRYLMILLQKQDMRSRDVR